jgi:hypothetical protein
MKVRFIPLLFALGFLFPVSHAADDSAAIIKAAKKYVAAESAVTDAVITVEEVSGDYARIKVESADNSTDPATAFLKRSKAKWKVLVLGTAFAPGDFEELGIPAEVRN